jgi:hypothetical protein
MQKEEGEENLNSDDVPHNVNIKTKGGNIAKKEAKETYILQGKA